MATILTMGFGPHEELLDLVAPSLESYAARHGYQLTVLRNVLDTERPPAWSKLLAIREALAEHDEVFWIDSDAIIVDPTVDVRSEIRADTELAWVVHDFLDGAVPNSGVMLIRRSARILQLIDAAYDQLDLIDHVWWENAALMRVLGYLHPSVPTHQDFTPMEVNVELLDSRWNVLRQLGDTLPTIRHFAGDRMPIRMIGLCELVLSHPGIEHGDGRRAQVLQIARASLERHIGDLCNSMDTVAEFADVYAAIDDLQAELASARAGAEREKEIFYSSTSWRVTAPLRAISTAFRRS